MLSFLLAPEIIVALCTGALGTGIWLLRLEGKFNLHEETFKANAKALEKGQEALKAHLEAEVVKREVLERSIRNDLTEIKVSLTRLVTIMEDRK